jgi:hypothetical protein
MLNCHAKFPKTLFRIIFAGSLVSLESLRGSGSLQIFTLGGGVPFSTVATLNVVTIFIYHIGPMSSDIETSSHGKSSPETDLKPFFNYLQSQQGHEITGRLLSVVEDIKKSTLEKTTGHAAFEKWLQAGIIFVVVVAASLLSYLGKFDTSLGVLFGTLVGYIFGKK